MRLSRSRILIAFASAVMPALDSAARLEAQEPVAAPATHTVKKGDTLWDLAQQYLGDPFQWPQIYQLNTELIKDPHWIYPGQVFRLPGGAAPGAPAAGAGAGPMGPAGPTRNMSVTIFNPELRRVERRAREAQLTAMARTAVRPGDYESSPFVWSEGGPAGGGRVDGTTEPNAIKMTIELRPIQPREQVVVTLPAGVEGIAGAKLLVYRLGPILGAQGQVVIPTGVIQVAAGMEGRQARAILTQKYEDVYVGHGLIPLDTLAMPLSVFPARVEFGVTTRVVWVQSSPALMTAGAKMIFADGATLGLATGDQLTLRAAPRGDGTAPAPELGVVQVTRVTQWGASGVLLDVRDGGIVPGTRAHVSAKMP